LERLEGGFTPARTSQVLIRLAEGLEARQVRAEIESAWKTFRASLDVEPYSIEGQLLDFVAVETWQERQREFIQAVEKEKMLVTILFGVISIVAVVLIGCIFYMVVEKKIRDIGIIKSLGASSLGVAWIFIVYGAAVGVVGSVLGTVGGVFFVKYINEFQELLVRLNPKLQVWSPDVYTFDRIPNVVDPTEAVVIVIVAVFASMLGALIPAILAARVWPVDALRYE
jgi:lipoprotein-releasing system permease protein